MASISLDSQAVCPFPVRRDGSCRLMAFSKTCLWVTPTPPARSTSAKPERKSPRCDLLHRRLPRPGLNHQNGSENPSIVVRSAIRHRHRLCLDRDRRSRRPVGAGLPHPDLTYFRAVRPRCFIEYVRAGQGFMCRRRFVPPSRRSPTIVKSRQAPLRQTRIFESVLCESGIRRIAASDRHKTGALSLPLIRQSSAKTKPSWPHLIRTS
jgi:hypothetical protein